MRRKQKASQVTLLGGFRDKTYAPSKEPDHIEDWMGGVINGDGCALKFSTGFDSTSPDFHAGRVPCGSSNVEERYLDDDVDARLKGLEL